MNLTELRLLAEEAKSFVVGHHECCEPYVDACSPKRILALLRVAEAAKVMLVRGAMLNLRKTLRDLEATP